MGSFLQRYLPLGAIAIAFIWSCFVIVSTRKAEAPLDAKVIHIAHWQLEAGVREGLAKMAQEFAELPDTKQRFGKVVIIQDAIPEGVYPQWVSCQVIGGTAPDLLEWGMGLSPNIWLSYANRYCLPLSTLANQPNPYNKGSPLDGVPLRNTFTDALRSGYQEELQQFMRINLSRFTTRVFYNRTLLKKLTGLDNPPHDYRGFLALCDQISKIRDPDTKKFYAPIASSSYHTGMWNGTIADSHTFATIYKADFNRDATVGSDETYVAFKTKSLSFADPAMHAKLAIARDVQQYFQVGFTGLSRDEAVLLFAQQNAVFISSGTWDAGSLIEISKGKFDVGIMNYPEPLPTDPDYGSVSLGPVYDPAGSGFPFALTRFHPANTEAAKAFLLYLASYDGNSRLNQAIGWIPTVKGAKLPKALEKFAPNNQGIYGTTSIDGLGGKTNIKWQQCFSRFQTDPNYKIDDLVAEFTPYYIEQGLADWQEQQRDWRRTILNNDQFLAGLRGEILLSGTADLSDSRWITYRTYVAGRQVFPEVGHKAQEDMVKNGPPRPVGAYEFLPEAIAHLKKTDR